MKNPQNIMLNTIMLFGNTGIVFLEKNKYSGKSRLSIKYFK